VPRHDAGAGADASNGAGQALGGITAKALDVLRALLWGFHNARNGLCFPSYETIADKAGCARSTVAEAIKALENAGLLTWCHRRIFYICIPAGANCSRGTGTISAISCVRWRRRSRSRSLSSLKEKLIKIGAKVISHGRSIAFQMAEVAIPRHLFQEILRLIAELRRQPPPATA
jgi:DNA-binding Lrp family transcriptional regulator